MKHENVLQSYHYFIKILCVGGPQHETWIRNIKSLTVFPHFFRFYQIFSVSFLVWLGFSAIIPSQSCIFRIYMNIIIYMSHLALLKINLNYFIFQISFNKLFKIWEKKNHNKTIDESFFIYFIELLNTK